MTYSRDYDAALFIDLDEYAMLHGKTAYEIVSMNSRAFCISLSWCFFGSRTSCEVDRTNLLRRFTWRAKLCDRHVKPFVNFKNIRDVKLKPFFFNPHCIFHHTGAYIDKLAIISSVSPSGQPFVGAFNDSLADPAEVPCIAHFYAKSEEEFEEKVNKGRADSPANS